jgi:serine/threonine-protein kinase
VCAIVDRALAFDRGSRYPDALAMQADVRAARGDAPPEAPTRNSDQPTAIENLKTERMNGPPAMTAMALQAVPEPVVQPAPPPAPVSTLRRLRFVLIAAGLFLVGILLLVGAFVLGARSDAGPAEAPAASESAATTGPQARPSAPETSTVRAPAHAPPRPAPPVPKGNAQGR